MHTDFWATYLFILPIDSAISLVEQTAQIDAVIIAADNSMKISSGLKKSLTPLSP
jgi:thiamine biosynthesis lipoprotein ApbE